MQHKLGRKSTIPVEHNYDTLAVMRTYWNSLIRSHHEEHSEYHKGRMRKELDRVREFIDKNKAPHC